MKVKFQLIVQMKIRRAESKLKRKKELQDCVPDLW